jgi:large subunit ribosomal protein L15
MSLHNLTPALGSIKKGKRIARGEGSGKGGTARMKLSQKI